MKTVLYLNKNIAVWICFQRLTAVNVHVESQQISATDYQTCSWLKNKRASVHLVVDFDQTEIESYPLQHVGSSLGQRSNRLALRSRLSQQNPDAVIHVPAKSTGINAALVHQMNLPESTRRWLTYVESSGLAFCSVMSVSEIVADLFLADNADCLVLSNILGFQRHTYSRSGQALFTRSFEHSELHGATMGLHDTMTHLQSSQLIHESLPVYSIGFSEQQLKEVDSLELVEKTQRFEQRPCSERQQSILHDSVEMNRYSAAIHIARHALKHSGFRKNHAYRQVTVALPNHERQQARRSQFAQLAMVSSLVLVSVGYSGSKQWQKVQTLSHAQKSVQALTVDIEQLRADVLNESAAGIALSSALLDTIALAVASGPGPATVLAIVSQLFTSHRELVLLELHWVTIDEHDNEFANEIHSESHSESHSVSSQERVHQFEDQARMHSSPRPAMPAQDAVPSRLVVTLSGTNASNVSLREQQNALNAAVASLRQRKDVSQTRVLESPLTALSENNQSLIDDELRRGKFRIVFELTRPASDENG